ncbi:hypothetical protein C2845_PM05G00970 [Panicum miliaceum]|uniref:Uncharacterized protein n=1 Tax=Panicum miliaceum TaxID=4540 RepID=A0A3L6T2S8_PANMI|nr:hypothetical protein C2845_PM05G00970 [Panicum miliaceum]
MEALSLLKVDHKHYRVDLKIDLSYKKLEVDFKLKTQPHGLKYNYFLSSSTGQLPAEVVGRSGAPVPRPCDLRDLAAYGDAGSLRRTSGPQLAQDGGAGRSSAAAPADGGSANTAERR